MKNEIFCVYEIRAYLQNIYIYLVLNNVSLYNEDITHSCSRHPMPKVETFSDQLQNPVSILQLICNNLLCFRNSQIVTPFGIWSGKVGCQLHERNE